MLRRSLLVAASSLLVACSSSSAPSAPTDAAGPDADTMVAETSGDVVLEAAPDALTEGLEDAAPLDCTWVRDPNNCWRTFVAAVDDCLRNPVGASVRGSLAADGRSCTYPSGGRSIVFGVPVGLDGPDRDDRAFNVNVGGTMCLHYDEFATTNGFYVTSSLGALTYTAFGNDVVVECPDGTRYRGDALSISKLCGPAVFSGGVPGRSVSSSGGQVRFQLNGMKDVVYACVAAADAGT